MKRMVIAFVTLLVFSVSNAQSGAVSVDSEWQLNILGLHIDGVRDVYWVQENCYGDASLVGEYYWGYRVIRPTMFLVNRHGIVKHCVFFFAPKDFDSMVSKAMSRYGQWVDVSGKAGIEFEWGGDVVTLSIGLANEVGHTIMSVKLNGA